MDPIELENLDLGHLLHCPACAQEVLVNLYTRRLRDELRKAVQGRSFVPSFSLSCSRIPVNFDQKGAK